MEPEPNGLAAMKQRMKAAWTAGDFGQIARYSEEAAEEFVSHLKVQPGMRVLDVACGTGNLAIPAARRGAEVTGIDIAPHLLEQARKRASAEGLQAAFDEGDAEHLPYRDAQYDLVMSMFGAMFAPRPERTAAELARVCRPGGVIAMANWTSGGFVGRMFAIGSRYLPPPDGVPAPILWGNVDVARERLGAYCSAIRAEVQTAVFDFPFEPKEVTWFFREYFGPVRTAFSRLPADEQSSYAADLEGLWRRENQGQEGRTRIYAEYLSLSATRA